jgi:hypothetical protein
VLGGASIVVVDLALDAGALPVVNETVVDVVDDDGRIPTREP